MKLHNTLTRSVDEFKPQNDEVSFYSCGPTVYDSLTIGNWTAYIRWDVLARTLRRHFKLKWYMNITDVGHLVSDADDGEDKLEKGAKRDGKTAWEVAEKYTNDFIEGLDKLNISIPKSNLVKATDNIQEQIDLINTLDRKGFTYVINDGVYFDSTKFADYGKMARLDLEGLRAGARVNIGDKKNATDFALWKFSPKNKKRDMEWDSPWGKGFPGWHIECSAMAIKYLGDTLDIHSGGIDHIPIHHTNEIAQSEAATDKQFARFWVHSNFLKIDGTKIAKSLGNGYTLQDLVEKDFSTMDFKLLVLQSNFQTEANFTWDNLAAAKTRLSDFQRAADLRFQTTNSAPLQNELIKNTQSRMDEALQDNLNTPKALAELSLLSDKLSNGINTADLNAYTNFIKWIDESLGLELSKSVDITDDQKQKIADRLQARQEREWQKSDQLRDNLKSEGIELSDQQNQTIWYRS